MIACALKQQVPFGLRLVSFYSFGFVFAVLAVKNPIVLVASDVLLNNQFFLLRLLASSVIGVFILGYKLVPLLLS